MKVLRNNCEHKRRTVSAKLLPTLSVELFNVATGVGFPPDVFPVRNGGAFIRRCNKGWGF